MYPELREPSFGSFVASLNRGLSKHTNCDIDVLRRRDGARGLSSYITMTADGLYKGISDRNYDLVHGHYIGVAAGVAWAVSKLLRVPLILTAHGSDVEAANEPAARFLQQRLYAQCGGLHFVSESLRERARDLLGTWDVPTLVTPTGVDLSQFSPEGECHLPISGTQRVVMVGQTVEHKGWADALEALSIVRQQGMNIELVAIGGPRLGWLKGLAANYGVADALRCEGEVPHHDLAAYYRGADVVLVASHREGFGLVGLEAMACGAGLVTTAVGGMKTYTEHQHNAWVVEPRDPKSIADGLSRVLRDSDLKTKLSQGGLETVELFSVEQSARKLANFYRQVVSL